MVGGVPTLIDRAALSRARRRGRQENGDHFLLRTVAADVAERIGAVARPFGRCLEISPVPAALATPLLEGGKAEAFICGITGTPVGVPGPTAACIDEEWLPFAPGSFDLVASLLTLHAVNDLPGVLLQIRKCLRPDGLFIGGLFGRGTLAELRHAFTAAEGELTGGAAPRVMPFADVREVGDLLARAGLSLAVADVDRLVVRYRDPFALMRDLRGMGETNVLRERSRRPLSRAVLTRMCEIYAREFSDPDGRIRATFEIITITGWHPAPGQPKPLAPGSATTRLADQLGTREMSAGDRARPVRSRRGESG